MPTVPNDYWPCACIKRNRKGELTHIKAHPPSRKKCRKCGATKPAVWPPPITMKTLRRWFGWHHAARQPAQVLRASSRSRDEGEHA
jgi:hypothetical protein